MEIGDLKVFEVTAAGFDASSDDTDDFVFWVSATSQGVVKDVIKDTGATYCGEVEVRGLVNSVDFRLPQQSMQFSSALLAKASALRNLNRAVL